jgi:hypothetical protein
MSDSDIKLSETEINELHERVLRTAQARDSFAGNAMDAGTLARIATESYRRATREGKSLEETESMALAALSEAASESRRMGERALAELEKDAADPEGDRRWGFLSDLLVPLLSVSIAVAGGWVYVRYGDAVGNLFGVVALLVFGLAALAAVSMVFVRRSVSTTLSHWMRAPLLQSGGAIASGFLLIVVLGPVGRDQFVRLQRSELDAQLQQFNQALAVTVAGAKAGASLAQTQAAVRKVTDADWIQLVDQGSTGCRRALAGQTAKWQVNTCSAPGQLQLVSFVPKDSGAKDFWFEYLSGKVVKTDLNTVTLLLDDDRKRIVSLPDNTLAPAENSEVVAAVPRGKNKATFLQPIDALVATLAHTTE